MQHQTGLTGTHSRMQGLWCAENTVCAICRPAYAGQLELIADTVCDAAIMCRLEVELVRVVRQRFGTRCCSLLPASSSKLSMPTPATRVRPHRSGHSPILGDGRLAPSAFSLLFGSPQSRRQDCGMGPFSFHRRRSPLTARSSPRRTFTDLAYTAIDPRLSGGRSPEAKRAFDDAVAEMAARRRLGEAIPGKPNGTFDAGAALAVKEATKGAWDPSARITYMCAALPPPHHMSWRRSVGRWSRLSAM